MRLFHVSLKKSEGWKANFLCIAIIVLSSSAFVAPEAVLSMIAFLVSPQTAAGFKALAANGA
jgi:hypothetical protein